MEIRLTSPRNRGPRDRTIGLREPRIAADSEIGNPMLDGRCLVPIAIAACFAASGCQYQTPVAATTLANGKLPDRRAIPISFDDLQLDMQEDAVFESSMLTQRVKELDGQRVRIRGFIFPAIFQQTGITQFPLIKNTQCKFGPGGLAHHIILVDLQPGLSTSFTVRPIAVEGLLTVRPFHGPDGNTWTIYHLVGDKID